MVDRVMRNKGPRGQEEQPGNYARDLPEKPVQDSPPDDEKKKV